MPEYTLSFKPSGGRFGSHDASTAIFKDGELEFCIEEERLCRSKHAVDTFPEESIKKCLDSCDIGLESVNKVLIPYNWGLRRFIAPQLIKESFKNGSVPEKILGFERAIENQLYWNFCTEEAIRDRLSDIGEFTGDVEELEHHKCHAASAFYPSGFKSAIIATLDGVGEHDSTVIWKGTEDGIKKLESYKYPNSLGVFYSAVTQFLGFRRLNGEGKIMGLAPYGEKSETGSKLRSLVETSSEYDVTQITGDGEDSAVKKLEKVFGRDRRQKGEPINRFHKNLAYAAQGILEETAKSLIKKHSENYDESKICFAGGTALNCKMTKKVRELDCVDQIYVQPAAHDAGLSTGAGFLKYPEAGRKFSSVYTGPEFSREEIKKTLERNKIEYSKPENLERYIAERMSEGKLVGWFQGRTEFGPRALGNRSILADPRTEESRKRINEHVKGRENWRPFAPTILEDHREDLLISSQEAPYMAQTFDVKREWIDRLEAVIHPEDQTSRPQTVSKEENPRYQELISEFENITGVPAVLNTSFNRSGEPIVNTPEEALRAFYSMGLDLLVLEDLIVKK